MEWLEKPFDTAMGGLPAPRRRCALSTSRSGGWERLGDHHPSKTISANQGLVRATRL
jgi:hypothetical protein